MPEIHEVATLTSKGQIPLPKSIAGRTLYGARIALAVTLVAGTLTCAVGATLGLLAGFLRDWVDVLISCLIDIWMAFPPVAFSVLHSPDHGPGAGSVVDHHRHCGDRPDPVCPHHPGRANGAGSDGLRRIGADGRAGAAFHHGYRDPAEHVAHRRRSAEAGNAYRCDRGGDPQLREPVDFDR